MTAISARTDSASSSSSSSTSSSESSSSPSAPVSPIHHPQRPTEQSSEEEEENAEVECPSFVRDRTISRALHEFELEDDDIPEPDFSWDARTISHHLAKYLDDLCGWVPDPKVQYRRVAPSQGKNGQRTKGTTKSDLEAQVRRLSLNSRVASRMKALTMEFEFRHYHNPKKYMEQYRRYHTCGGPLEKLAAHDTSCGRKRSIYYAGDASAEAGFKVDNPHTQQESRLTAAQLQPASSSDRNDGQRPTQSRQRQNSDSRSDQSRTDSTSVSSGTTLPKTVSSQNSPVQNESVSTLPRYCSLTEAANRKRQVYSHWMGIPSSRLPVHVPSSAPKSSTESDRDMSSNLPTKLPATDDAMLMKPQSSTPTGTGSTTALSNKGLRPTYHNPLMTSPTGAPSVPVTQSTSQFGSPPSGQHPLWKPTQYPATADNHTLPVAFGYMHARTQAVRTDRRLYSGMAGNFSTGITLDDSCYGYQGNGVTSSEGSAFRDFYSHLLQAAHYLRLAGRQKSMENANKHGMGPRHHSGPALYKSTKTISVTSPTNEISSFAEQTGLPSNVAISNGLGVRGQRLNSATDHQRSSHSANPSFGTRQFVNAPAFKSIQARFNSSPAKISNKDLEAETGFSRKRFISLEPPASSTFRENVTKTVPDGAHDQKGKTGKMFHISIPQKPCKAEAAQVNKASVCQAVCFKSESQEALALANGNTSKK
ncbi:serine-rich adhesin for platelets-like isoform X2 [Lytechinus variegatus]|uniref:serine-rich adhesin for platelets-like isoform X2 n=1 Tax=Lytechinus variegatus TaxID=7654 RepID=UPI001BB1A79B|nr:serine-rich adhesin for platelets-like isoform X2 [Lytechinus variegatus]